MLYRTSIWTASLSSIVHGFLVSLHVRVGVGAFSQRINLEVPRCSLRQCHHWLVYGIAGLKVIAIPSSQIECPTDFGRFISRNPLFSVATAKSNCW